MQRVNEYPTQIVGPFKSAEKANDESAMHKSLLDMGESFLTYLVGIMFGEYKRSDEISDKLETEFYKYSSRKPSFGVFLSFMRLLSKEMNDTILSSKFDKSNKYASVSDFVFNFTLLKSVIDEGSDDGFNDAVDTLKKGRNASQNGLMDFFDTFIMIRNIFAHPDEKAGPKDNKRKWPLGEEYYAFINPYMLAALTELVEDFDILSAYKPVIARMLDDKNKKGTFILEQGGKESEIDMDLSTDDLKFMNTDLRYLLDPDDKLFVKLYYHAIPQLNPEVAKKIIDREKAKAMEPHLKEMIHGKLVDDGKIDDMEYLVLRDTAKTSSISDERLFQLIDAVKNQLQIKESVGTPENKGDIFIEAKSLDTNPRFNPWWLYYLTMVKNIDKAIPKAEKNQVSALNKKISALKKSKKSLPINKRIENAKKNLKKKKEQKATQLKKMRERVASKQEMRKKATKPERKAALLDEINSLRYDIETKREVFDVQIEELVEKINIIEQEKAEKVKDIDDKIEQLELNDSSSNKYRQWTIHKGLWADIGEYVNHLLDSILNSADADEDDDVEREWIMKPNQWQIGALAYTYWGKIFPAASPLGMGFHVGFAVSRSFQWLGTVPNPITKEKIGQPCICMWPSIDVKYAAKIDPEVILLTEYKRLIRVMFEENLDVFKKVGANIQCIDSDTGNNDTIPLEYYLDHKDRFNIYVDDKSYALLENSESFNLFSKIWTIDDFMSDGRINYDNVTKFERDISVYMTLISNVIKQLNDFALANGINKESINKRLDQVNRLSDIINSELEKFVTDYKLVLSEEDDARLLEYSRTIGLDAYTYQYIKDQFVFTLNYEGKEAKAPS